MQAVHLNGPLIFAPEIQPSSNVYIKFVSVFSTLIPSGSPCSLPPTHWLNPGGLFSALLRELFKLKF